MKKHERKLSRLGLFTFNFPLAFETPLPSSSKKTAAAVMSAEQVRLFFFIFSLSLLSSRELFILSSRRGHQRRGGRCRAPARRAERMRLCRREKKTIASSSSSRSPPSSLLQTARARPPFRPDPPPRSSSNPAQARPDQFYLRARGLDSSEWSRQGAGSEGEEEGCQARSNPRRRRRQKSRESMEVFFPSRFRPPRSTLLFSFRVDDRGARYRRCAGSVGGSRAARARALSHAFFHFFSLVAFFSSKKKTRSTRSTRSTPPFPSPSAPLSHSLSTVFEKMETKKTTTPPPPPKQPPRFLLFGGTGWIGGLVSELLTKEGATWQASKARLEDRALILKEIEEVRR